MHNGLHLRMLLARVYITHYTQSTQTGTRSVFIYALLEEWVTMPDIVHLVLCAYMDACVIVM